MKKSELIYIMGAGRSGSTILGIILGSLKDTFYAGELYRWNVRSGIPNTDSDETKLVWEKINQGIEKKEEYFTKTYLKYFEYHYSFFYHMWKNLSDEQISYFEANSELLKSIINVTGIKFVVDSSHYPMRINWLCRNNIIDSRIIYLYRNPLYVIESFKKENEEQKRKNLISANIYLLMVGLLSAYVYLRTARKSRMFLRYEEMIGERKKFLARTGKLVGVTLDAEEIEFENLDVGHLFDGNRLRKLEKLSVLTEIPPSKLKTYERIITLIFQWPILLINKFL